MMGSNGISIEDQEPKMKLSEKIAVTVNNGTGTFHQQVMQLFMLFFYTEYMHISAAYLAVMFLVVRIFDAALTPLFGLMMDKVSIPGGKYKPWLIWIGALSGIFGFLAFFNFHLESPASYVYVTITYFFYSIVLSMIGAPVTAITPIVTKSVDARMALSQVGYFIIIFFALLSTMGVQPLYKALGHGNDSLGLGLVMAVFMVLSILCAIWQRFTIKERYALPQKTNGEKGPSVAKMLNAIVHNKAALIVYIYAFAVNFGNGLRNGLSLYYFKYYFHNDMLVTLSGAVALLPTFIGVIISPKLVKHIGVRNAMLMSAIVTVISLAVVIALPPTMFGIVGYMIAMAVMAFATGLANPAQGTMLPAAIDYTEWKTGMNLNGFMGSFQGFLQTLATALSTSLAAGALAWVGYVEGAATQSSGTLMGFRIFMSIIPAVITALTITVVGYDLTVEKQSQIAKELSERRKAEECSNA